jgi:hypothetical protein
MTAMHATPRLELPDCLLATDLQVDRLRRRLRELDRRLDGARPHLAGPDARSPVGSAYLRRVGDDYEERRWWASSTRPATSQALVRIG